MLFTPGNQIMVINIRTIIQFVNSVPRKGSVTWYDNNQRVNNVSLARLC